MPYLSNPPQQQPAVVSYQPRPAQPGRMPSGPTPLPPKLVFNVPPQNVPAVRLPALARQPARQPIEAFPGEYAINPDDPAQKQAEQRKLYLAGAAALVVVGVILATR